MGTIFSRVKLSGKHVAALLALMLLSAVTAMLLPTALASMIDIGVAGENRNTILIIAAVMATLAILGCLFNMAATVLSAKVSTKFAADLRREIFHQVQDFSAAEMERFGTASLVTRSTSDVTNIQMFLSLLLRLGVTAPLMAVAGLVLSSLTGGELSSVLSLAIPALIIGVGVILIFVSRYSVTLRQRIDRLNKIFLETLEGVRVIRAFNRQGKEMERFSQANGELASMTILSGRVTALLMPVIQVIFGVTTAAVMGMGSWYVSAGEMAVGDLVANSQYISMILAAIMMLALVIMLFPVSYACAKRIAEVLNTESSIKDGRYSAALRKGRACVAFDHVTFTYPGADEPVLKDVSFECRAGEVTAIIGRTGCGKSSILKLLCGQDIPYSGTLETASRLVISYVPQDASGLRGGLRDYAAGYGLDESLFLAILRKLGFERVQFEKDMGDYSAGQKKKVLLARSLCQSAHLYVWDEPLNYIDVLSRIQIEELLQAFRPTLLFVEHDRVFCENIATKVVEM